MSKKDAFRRYLDAGSTFTQITRTRAEELVQELVKSGALQRKEAKARVDELIERSRKSSEQLIQVVRDEVASQMSALGISSIEDLARQVASLLNRSTDLVRGQEKAAATTAPAKKAPAKKAAATKAPAKKAAAKKTAAKKAPAKKTAAKKTAAKKAPAKKAAATTAPTAAVPASPATPPPVTEPPA